MDRQYVLDGVVGFPFNQFELSNGTLEEIENTNVNGDPAPYEKVILEDMDSYWDDFNSYLIVSRMVNDAVIKGIVNAVTQDAAADIRSKEAQVEGLSDRLRFYEFDVTKGNKFALPMMPERVFMEKKYKEHLCCLKTAAEEQLQKFKNELECMRSFTDMEKANMCSENVRSCSKEKVAKNLGKMEESLHGFMESIGTIYQGIGGIFCFFNNSLCEQKCMWDIQKDLSGTIVQNRVNELQEEFDTKMEIERNIYTNQTNNCSKRCDKLTSLRNELDALSKALFNSEIGYFMSYNSHETMEECNNDDRRDYFYCKALGNHLPYSSYKQENGADQSEKSKKSMLEVFESPHLSHMKREELIGYFKNEVMKTSMNHEIALQQKTEELFKAKRQLLKMKGTMPLKKDSEFEILRKKILELLVKLDNVIVADNTFPTENDLTKPFGFKDQNDNLICENQHLRDLLAVKQKEIKSLLARASDTASQISNHSLVETEFINHITQLRGDMEYMKLEANLREELHTIVLSENIGEIHSHSELSRMEVNINHEIYSIILQGFIEDVRSAINAIVIKCNEQNEYLEAVIIQKDGKLCLEVVKTNNLKNDIESLSKFMEEKERSMQEVELKLVQQKDQSVVVYAELCMLKEKASAQEKLISKIMSDSDLLNIRLQEANVYVEFYKKEKSKVDEMLNDTSIELIKAENQTKFLHENVKQQEERLETLILDKRRHEEMLMKPLVTSVLNMSKAFEDFGSSVTKIIQKKISRLEKLKYQCDPIILLSEKRHRETSSIFKKIIETKSLNLQKAETEVDLLGDDVDVLLSVLVKVYIALNHYSPVLQHYPGVMEILKLVKKEIEAHYAKPIQL